MNGIFLSLVFGCIVFVQQDSSERRSTSLTQGAPTTQVVEHTQIRVRQVATNSIGDKIAWNADVVAAEIELTTAQSQLITKCLEQRLAQREESIEECVSGINAAEQGDRKSVDECMKALATREAKHEKMLLERLEEILLPQQLLGLVQSIIRRDNLGFAEIQACAAHLSLTTVQISAFVKAKEKMMKILADRALRGESNAGVIPEEEKLGEAIMSPIHLLDKSQLEKYLHARKVVDNDVSLEDHYKKIGLEDRERLKKMFPIFKAIDAQIEKDSSDSSR